jgi:hypothetical protein
MNYECENLVNFFLGGMGIICMYQDRIFVVVIFFFLFHSIVLFYVH